MDLSYILNELGEERENYFNAISPPIIQTSNFAFNKVEDLTRVLDDEMSDYLYSRGLNPTVEILRKKMAALDGAEDCLVFNSGASHFCKYTGQCKIRRSCCFGKIAIHLGATNV